MEVDEDDEKNCGSGKNMQREAGAGKLALKWAEANDFALLNLPIRNGAAGGGREPVA